MTKVLQYRRMGISPDWSKESNALRSFKCQTGRHDFTEQTCHGGIRQWPFITFHDITQNLSFTFCTVKQRILFCGKLCFCHSFSQTCPTGNQLLNLLINRIDNVTNFYQIKRSRGVLIVVDHCSVALHKPYLFSITIVSFQMLRNMTLVDYVLASYS